MSVTYRHCSSSSSVINFNRFGSSFWGVYLNIHPAFHINLSLNLCTIQFLLQVSFRHWTWFIPHKITLTFTYYWNNKNLPLTTGLAYRSNRALDTRLIKSFMNSFNSTFQAGSVVDWSASSEHSLSLRHIQNIMFNLHKFQKQKIDKEREELI